MCSILTKGSTCRKNKKIRFFLILTLVRPIICYCSSAVNQLSGEIFLELQTFTKIEITQLLTNQFKCIKVHSNHNKLLYQIHDNDITTMLWMNRCNAMLKWEKSRKSHKSTKVAYGSHTDICKINESCTRSYKG